jgi:hypothetical protein
MEKFDSPLVVLEVVLPHGFEDSDDEPPDLPQSKLVPCVVIEGVEVVGEITLFMPIPMPIAGLACCWEKDELPMPGLLGVIAGNDEFRVLKVLSGVIVLLVPWGAERFVAGGDTGGVDHEKAGEPLFDDFPRFTAGLEGSIVDEEAEAGAFAQGSPPSISVPLDVPPFSPRTSASKSVSPFPFAESRPLVPLTPPKLMKSFRDVAVVVLLAPSSWSFRVCSFSTRDERFLISAIYDWNWVKLRSGPRLNCQRIGRTSIARKSLSTRFPIALNTSRAAIWRHQISICGG